MIGAVLVVASGIAYWQFGREILVRVAAPEQNVAVRVFGIGAIEAQVVSKVGFQIAGKMIAIEADQGDFVKSGAVLARLDDEAQRAKVKKSEAAQRQAAATLAKTEAQRARAEITYQQKKNVNVRRQTLASRGSVSQEAAEDAQAAEEIALGDAKVIEADTRVAAVQQDDANSQRKIDAVVLAQHELRALFDARVISRHKELGSIANAGEAVFTLIAPDSIWVKAYVDEALAGGLSVGQPAIVRLRSEPDRLSKPKSCASIRRTTGSPKSGASMCAARPAIRSTICVSSASRLRSRSSRRLFRPASSCRSNSVEGYDGRSGTVWVLQDGRLAKRRVQTGERLLDGRVQLTSELPGPIVIDDRADLREGRAARARSGS